MSESKATKSSLLKSTVAASTQRWQKNPEEQTGPKWNNALSRKVSLEPQKTPPAKKYDVSSKFTSPTKSSSSKETVKRCDRAPPSVASPPAAINEHSRLLQKSTASFLASQRQKCPLDNLKVFHTVVNPKVGLFLKLNLSPIQLITLYRQPIPTLPPNCLGM